MKKNIKILCIATVTGCPMAFPSRATEMKAEYKEGIVPARAELEALESGMRPIRGENKAFAARYKSIRLSKKETDSLSVSKGARKKAKELHSRIMATRKDMGKSTGKDLRQQIRTVVREKNFHVVIQSMDRLLGLKKSRQDPISEIHQIWQQIDTLLQQGQYPEPRQRVQPKKQP